MTPIPALIAELQRLTSPTWVEALMNAAAWRARAIELEKLK